MFLLHLRRIRAMIRLQYRVWRTRHEPTAPEGRYEHAWDRDLPVSGSPQAGYGPTKAQRRRG
ncbi:MAG: hypothetical protein ACRYF3_15010 [Janthinobacterium lividum]